MGALILTAALMLTACEMGRGPEFIHLASTDSQPVSFEYGVEVAEGDFSTNREGPIRGLAAIEVNTANGECTHRNQLRIISDDTGEVLHQRDLMEDPVCDGDRLVWDGAMLHKLDDGGPFSDPEPWPDDIYDE